MFDSMLPIINFSPTTTMLASLSWDDFVRTLSMRDWGTRMVIAGTALLGLASGIIGVFMLLRKRSLLGDALSHAMLPGVALAFLVFTVGLGWGRSLPLLLMGAAFTGIVGALSVLAITRYSRLKEDAALAIVLSVYFGLGVALLAVINKLNLTHLNQSGVDGRAGLDHFIFGSATNLMMQDALIIAAVAGFCFIVVLFLRKEFTLITFDTDFAGSQGWPAGWIDLAITGLAIAIIVVGIQAVGLILVIALLIIPAAGARFWTHKLTHMLLLAACFGAVSGWLGALLSSLLSQAPAGAMIVIAAGLLFIVSMVFGSERGLLKLAIRQRRLRRRVRLQHLMRALYESYEGQLYQEGKIEGIAFDQLLAMRSWDQKGLHRTIKQAANEKWVWLDSQQRVHLTKAGEAEAARVTREHRLWEAYLLTHAEIAPSMVDHEADRIEHVLSSELIAQLEKVMRTKSGQSSVPKSVHVIETGGGAG